MVHRSPVLHDAGWGSSAAGLGSSKAPTLSIPDTQPVFNVSGSKKPFFKGVFGTRDLNLPSGYPSLPGPSDVVP